jgi:hypothetical protein
MSGVVDSGRESGHGNIDANDPTAVIGRIEIPRCSGLLPHRGVLCLEPALQGHQRPSRFRTIQIRPKDWPAAMRQAEREEDRPRACRWPRR